MNKKILILANMDIWVYNLRKELLEKLIEKKYDVTIGIPDGEKVEKLKEMGCNHVKVDLDRRGTNPIKEIRLFFQYLKILKRLKPDVVLTYTIKPNLYGGIACRMKKIKCIANVTGLGSALENNGLLDKVINILYKLAFKRNQCIFCQNQQDLNYLFNKGISKNILKLIPGSGVNLEKFKVLEYPKDEKIEFLFIGRILKSKGIDEYLKTAEYIKSKYDNTVFNVLGFCEEEYEEKLKGLQEKNIIKYYGLQDNIIPFLQRSHCTIHPTYYPEGMSNVLLESAASGRPIITTNRAGCRETVNNGISGYIVQEKNSQDLIEKVEKFIKLSNEEKKQMGMDGRKKVEKEFDRNIVIEAYLKEIRR